MARRVLLMMTPTRGASPRPAGMPRRAARSVAWARHLAPGSSGAGVFCGGGDGRGGLGDRDRRTVARCPRPLQRPEADAEPGQAALRFLDHDFLRGRPGHPVLVRPGGVLRDQGTFRADRHAAAGAGGAEESRRARREDHARVRRRSGWRSIYYSRCFSVCDRAAAQRGSWLGVTVTWCHLLPAVVAQVARAANRVL